MIFNYSLLKKMNKLLYYYGIGFISTNLLLHFFDNKKFLKNSFVSLTWPLILPKIACDLLLLPIFQIAYTRY